MSDKNISSQPRSRILAVLEPHPESARLLRAAKRKAEITNLDWEVVLIETPQMHRRLSSEAQESLLAMVTLAEQMGAIVTKVYSRTMLIGVQQIVKERADQGINIYSIKVGNIRNKPNRVFGKPLAQQLRKHFKDTITITTVPLGIEISSPKYFMNLLHVTKEEMLISLLVVTIATFLIEIMRYIEPDVFGLNNRNKTMMYLICCIFAAGRYGFLAGLITSTASFLALSMFYIPPSYSLLINDTSDAMSLALFLLAGLIVSYLGNRDHGSRLVLAKRADRFHSLLTIHRLALNKNTTAETVETLDIELQKLLGTEVVFFTASIMDERKLESLFVKDTNFNAEEEKALNICWEGSKTTGVGAPYCPPSCRWRFEPLITSRDEIGVLGIRIGPNIELDADFGRLLSGMADQLALILERMQLEHIAEENKIQSEREKLRAMLLSSVSHDLKTPLASIIGSLSVYRSMGLRLPEVHRLTLINTALEEAQRLDGFITNILEMTRIESGQIELKKEWIDPASMVDEVRIRLSERLKNNTINIQSDNAGMEVLMDMMMTGQVIQNLLDNAAKYTQAGTAIDLYWKADESGFLLSIRDHGAGIPEDQLEKIFDKYSRLKKQDSQVAGTGLGLAIARAVMNAQGGSITASNHADGGAVFTITLPEARKSGVKKVA